MALARNPSAEKYQECLNYMHTGLDTEHYIAEATEDTRSTMNPVNGSYISDDLITSTDSPRPPPTSPLHQGATFPTPSGIDQQTANDLCRAAITGAISAELYQECLNYTRLDTEHYVTSCVEDIKVTVLNLLLFIYLLCTSYQGTRKIMQESTKKRKKHTKNIQ